MAWNSWDDVVFAFFASLIWCHHLSPLNISHAGLILVPRNHSIPQDWYSLHVAISLTESSHNQWPRAPTLQPSTYTHTHTDTHTHTPPFYSCLILPPPSLGFPDGSASKESTCNVGGTDSFPGAERSPGEGHGNPLQYSRPENSMIRGALQESMGL